ncbi:UDP-N-acetyl-D-mannosamine transferase [Caballeronia novacaledonica]|uniref:UDP-N-acetyl-D-mannosamine transferase n=2 Tax=Caballeronia novacaledonica TaxID=1544861 RepID=A0A2U3I1S3_9BURK|nr:UDP-N-acetyl-D-mannosamine transferase [Caballeronia novacaledonica]
MHAGTMDETVSLIADRLEAREFTQHVVVNVAKLVHMKRDRALAESVQACDVINIDGMGVVWGARMLGHDVPERVAGIDLFCRLLEAAAHQCWPVYLLGATDAVVSKTVELVTKNYPGLRVAGYANGYFWDDEEAAVTAIRNSGARLLFVAITSPKKETFIERWKNQLGVDFVMGVGGTFDVIAGKVRRAPVWMQRCGLEWLFRVSQEPNRMWKRYLVTNAQFAVMLAKAYLARR